MGQRSFKKPFEFYKFREILYWTQEHKFGCFYTISIHKNHFEKQNYGTESV